MTIRVVQWTTGGVGRPAVRAVLAHSQLDLVGGFAWSADIYDLDAGALQAIAAEIGAPTLDELRSPIDQVPAGASVTAFRSGAGGWG